ncbi:MAG: hypothetical protein [Caudoviricetes sp.]|nr:MAG: hypothetical protein [Caudoviricetes sp.]
MLGPRHKIIKLYTIKARMSVDSDWMVLKTSVTQDDLFTLRNYYQKQWRYIEVERYV